MAFYIGMFISLLLFIFLGSGISGLDGITEPVIRLLTILHIVVAIVWLHSYQKGKGWKDLLRKPLLFACGVIVAAFLLMLLLPTFRIRQVGVLLSLVGLADSAIIIAGLIRYRQGKRGAQLIAWPLFTLASSFMGALLYTVLEKINLYSLFG